MLCQLELRDNSVEKTSGINPWTGKSDRNNFHRTFVVERKYYVYVRAQLIKDMIVQVAFHEFKYPKLKKKELL